MRILKKAVRFMSEPEVRFYCLDKLGIYKSLPDDKYLKRKFKLRTGYELDLEKPRSFNEKIQWLKLNDRSPRYVTLVDKFLVKDFVAATIGGKYVIPTIDSWDSADSVDFNRLPREFVIKCNHNSGKGIYICRDKETINEGKVRKGLAKALSEDYYIYNREWPYKNVKRRVLAEELLKENGGGELKDYKLMCFNGKVRCSFVCSDRFTKDGLKVTFFDRDWNVMPFERHYPKSTKEIRKPKNYELMVGLAEKLAEGICFVRVDFYEVCGRVYFGEMTFYPGSGFEEFTPREWDYKMGEWLDI